MHDDQNLEFLKRTINLAVEVTQNVENSELRKSAFEAILQKLLEGGQIVTKKRKHNVVKKTTKKITKHITADSFDEKVDKIEKEMFENIAESPIAPWSAVRAQWPTRSSASGTS